MINGILLNASVSRRRFHHQLAPVARIDGAYGAGLPSQQPGNSRQACLPRCRPTPIALNAHVYPASGTFCGKRAVGGFSWRRVSSTDIGSGNFAYVLNTQQTKGGFGTEFGSQWLGRSDEVPAGSPHYWRLIPAPAYHGATFTLSLYSYRVYPWCITFPVRSPFAGKESLLFFPRASSLGAQPKMFENYAINTFEPGD
ncbi:hypothetical protein KCP69_04600 [Salmonella enterica subsp. enterica]|nr:hypothetical protein KCP69_04600 [Salmonella enterica subsp. enterica]